MPVERRYLCASTAMLALIGSAVAADALLNTSAAQEFFPDVPPDYWATPFIQVLAQEEIVTGYPDGTFRPEESMDRDEFAAVVRKAFSQETERTISSASVFEDVPTGYWAETPIEEAYETGFMNQTGENLFSPQEPISKAEALMALTRGLEQFYTPALTSTPRQRRVAKNRLVFPLASTAMMAPLIRAASLQAANAPAATTSEPEYGPSAAEIVQAYYEDADQIPEDAVNSVAVATQKGLVVNYPDLNVLEPNQPISRGTASALVHQSLVNLGKLPPLADNLDVSQYIIPADEEMSADSN
ncbi:MAG: S-layer homology domain-containing protein [Cyanophyceae cyanobacterium]